MSSVEFRYLAYFPFIQFCVTSRIISPVRGNWITSIFFIILTLQVSVFTIFTTLGFLKIMNDENVHIVAKTLNAITIQGHCQIIFKNIGGFLNRKDFEMLVDWLEDLHFVKEGNKIVQEIVDRDLNNALKFSKFFFK